MDKSLDGFIFWLREKHGIMFGNLYEFHIFLQGHRFSRNQFNLPITEEEIELEKFDRWVHEKLCGDYSQCWAGIIQNKFPNDTWNKFFALLDEFRSSK